VVSDGYTPGLVAIVGSTTQQDPTDYYKKILADMAIASTADPAVFYFGQPGYEGPPTMRDDHSHPLTYYQRPGRPA